MAAPIPYTELSLHPDSEADRRFKNGRDFPEDSGDYRRITRIAPLPSASMRPVIGMATDTRILRALAVSGTGWVNRDGRVIAKGTSFGYEALLALPETAAIVAVQLRIGQERAAGCYEEFAEPQDITEEDIEANEPDMNDLVDHGFDGLLDDAGWLRVDLFCDRGVRTIGTGIPTPTNKSFMALLKPVHQPYRALLVSIADRLGCRVLAGTMTGMNMLLYDSANTEGLPFAQGYIGYQTRPAAPPMPLWPRNVVHERDEDYGDTVGFGM